MVQFARSKATATSAAWLSKSSNSFRSRNASPSMANPLLTSSVFYQPTKGGQFTTETPDSPIDLFRPPTPRAKADVHPVGPRRHRQGWHVPEERRVARP